MPEEGVITVEIHGQRYPIRSGLDEEYVTRLAQYVDQKMRAAADSTSSGDGLRLAVLTALNVADELFRCRDGTRLRNGELAERAGELERLLDSSPDGLGLGKNLGPCVARDGGWLVEPMFTQVSRDPAWCACLCNEEA